MAPLLIWQRYKYYLSGVGFFLILLLLAALFYPYILNGRDNLRSGQYKIAYSQFITAAEAGDASAQTVIGNLHRLRLGVTAGRAQSHLSTAAHWYLQAALKGHVPAQLNLASLYMHGAGVPRRADLAYGWYHLAAQSGNERAEAQLTYMERRISISPNQMSAARRSFASLEIVRQRFQQVGEAQFLKD